MQIHRFPNNPIIYPELHSTLGDNEPLQKSYWAISHDGIHFTADTNILGPFYFRVFEHQGWYYRIAKNGNVELPLLK